jgi:hypothetical protein
VPCAWGLAAAGILEIQQQKFFAEMPLFVSSCIVRLSVTTRKLL